MPSPTDAVEPVRAARTPLPAYWRFPADVHGWLTRREAETLASLAAGKTVLEIGSFKGRSTICMAQTAARVYALDWHLGGDGLGSEWTFPAFIANLRAYGLRDKVVHLIGTTEQVGPVLQCREFDLVFVDGAHDYESAGRDMRLADRVCKRGGVIALHDWNESGVAMAAADVLGWLDTDGRGETADDLHYRVV